MGEKIKKGWVLLLATRRRTPFSFHTGKDRGKVETWYKHDKERPRWVLL